MKFSENKIWTFIKMDYQHSFEQVEDALLIVINYSNPNCIGDKVEKEVDTVFFGFQKVNRWFDNTVQSRSQLKSKKFINNKSHFSCLDLPSFRSWKANWRFAWDCSRVIGFLWLYLFKIINVFSKWLIK